MDILAMSDAACPRLGYIDSETAKMALSQFAEDVPKLLEIIAAGRTRLIQTHFSSLASDYESIATLSYGLGLPLATVKDAFRNAACAYLKVFELRGTEPAFPVYSLTYDPAYPPSDAESLIEFKNITNCKVDYSLSNSQKNYFAVCQALGVGEDNLADKLAALIWDPPDASYIGPRSFCTANDHHLAYALRELIHGTAATMEAELKQLKLGKSQSFIRNQALMLQALATSDRQSFLECLAALLICHEQEASLTRNLRNPRFFLCLPAMGLCRLALRHRLCALENFPSDNVFLPTLLFGEK